MVVKQALGDAWISFFPDGDATSPNCTVPAQAASLVADALLKLDGEIAEDLKKANTPEAATAHTAFKVVVASNKRRIATVA